MTTDLFPALASAVRELQGSFASIPAERRTVLGAIRDFIEQRRESGDPARLIFICTHNSRRSHLAQIWAHTAAVVYDVPGVQTFSGGTEATAFNPRAVAAMQRTGFQIDAGDGGDNPVVEVRIGPEVPVVEAFSKTYDSAPNPTRDFCAVMTCSDADANCPLVLGASARISIPYEDPKDHDGTELESEMYDERCRQIGIEMLYAFSRVGESSLR